MLLQSGEKNEGMGRVGKVAGETCAIAEQGVIAAGTSLPSAH